MRAPKVVILAGRGASTNVVYHAIAREFPVARVVIEDQVPRTTFLKNRVKRLGVAKVVGQLAFIAIAPRLLRRSSVTRIAEIDAEYGMNRSPIPEGVVQRVSSVNDESTILSLRELAPDVIVVQGTRILSKRLLGELRCPVINMHAGITPLFRGVHGGYWALAEGTPGQCGVTIHLVDPGIDTGGILYQVLISPTERDNYVTYAELQLGAGLAPLRRAVRDALEGKLHVVPPPPGDSRLWSHPTLAEYLWYRFTRGVR